MINAELHRRPVALDRERHRQLRWDTRHNTAAVAASMNAFFVTAAEFGDASKEYPILFLSAGNDATGKLQVAPVAVFGVQPGQNLFWRDNRWDAYYLPAVLRAYPFTMAKVDEDNYAVCIDAACTGFSSVEGERLFTDAGEPTPLLESLHKFVQDIEIEVERTRRAGQRLVELNLLQPKRFDATLPTGEPLVVDGFLALDEARFAALSEAEIVELQRSGLLSLIYAHRSSLTNMRRLLERMLATPGATPPPAAAGAAA